MKTKQQTLNGIYIRKSANPLKKTSYAVYFRQGDSWIGRFVTDNGNIVDLGHVVNNFLNHESVPMGMEKYELGVKVGPRDDVPGVQPVAEKKHTFQTIMEDALEGLKNVPSHSKMEWKPVSEPCDETKYEAFTLVRVEDWMQRYGFGVHYSDGWRLRDPYNKEADTTAESRITHWLAIPLSLRKSMDNTKVC